MTASLDPAVVERFASHLDALVPRSAPVGIALSGGADSIALLLLAVAARPGRVYAATVDHGLRTDSADEARQVERLCASINVAHTTLLADWRDRPPTRNIEALAREARYGCLRDWARDLRIGHIATGHQADDQAETLLMRLARGAGLAGMAGIRAVRRESEIAIVRPLLRWSRVELVRIAEASGQPVVHDPHNSDPAFDRARLRGALADAGFGDAAAYAATAAHLAEAEEALDWMATQIGARVTTIAGRTVRIDIATLPHELQRRLLADAVRSIDGKFPRGPALAQAMERVETGYKVSLGGVTMHREGSVWTLAPAPPRRTG